MSKRKTCELRRMLVKHCSAPLCSPSDESAREGAAGARSPIMVLSTSVTSLSRRAEAVLLDESTIASPCLHASSVHASL